jgi:GDP-L-fucose synthase
MKKDSRILITGSQGLVGTNLIKELRKQGYANLYLTDKPKHNLLYRDEVEDLFEDARPEYVFHIAARVGGIVSNDTRSGEYIYENLLMQCNVIEQARLINVNKLLFMGSACIYPKESPQPIKEEYLLSGYLEETNRAYAIAKIAGLTMCQMYRKQYGCNFISAMPMNLYGPNDNFHLTESHVIPGMIRKFHDAKTRGDKEITLWGTGVAKREFLYVSDICDAVIFLMNNYNESIPVNVGSGEEITMLELANLIGCIVGFEGEIKWDSNYPDGVFQRKYDLTKIHSLGWFARTSLIHGLETTYEWFKINEEISRL